MKRTILFSTLCAAALMAPSCKKSDTDSLTGKWALQKEHTVITSYYVTPPETITEDTVFTPAQYFLFYEFDGKGGITLTNTADTPHVVQANYIIISSAKLGLRQSGATLYDTLNYSRSGNNLIFTGTDKTDPMLVYNYTITFNKQ